MTGEVEAAAKELQIKTFKEAFGPVIPVPDKVMVAFSAVRAAYRELGYSTAPVETLHEYINALIDECKNGGRD